MLQLAGSAVAGAMMLPQPPLIARRTPPPLIHMCSDDSPADKRGIRKSIKQLWGRVVSTGAANEVLEKTRVADLVGNGLGRGDDADTPSARGDAERELLKGGMGLKDWLGTYW